MTRMDCKNCKIQMKLQLRSERGEGVYWCRECGTVCKTVITAKDPINEKTIAWEEPTSIEFLD